jgi:hypothetical protein
MVNATHSHPKPVLWMKGGYILRFFVNLLGRVVVVLLLGRTRWCSALDGVQRQEDVGKQIRTMCNVRLYISWSASINPSSGYRALRKY